MTSISRRSFTDDFKAQAVSLAESAGQADAARQLEISSKTLGNWVRHSQAAQGEP
ncbi:MAG: transposase [Gammaproteobacteria bacterium]